MIFMPFKNNPPMVEGAYLVRLYTGERVIAVWRDGKWWGAGPDNTTLPVPTVQSWCDRVVPFGAVMAHGVRPLTEEERADLRVWIDEAVPEDAT